MSQIEHTMSRNTYNATKACKGPKTGLTLNPNPHIS
jgi:hypothetical protein